MESFRGTFTNKIDAKGRVSVPAKFRAALTAVSQNQVTVLPSMNGAFLEAGGPAFNAQIDDILNQLPPFSTERDQLSLMLVGNGIDIPFDGDGRMVLPKVFLEYAKIEDKVCFVGMINKFQIWAPAAYENFRRDAFKQAGQTSGVLAGAFHSMMGRGPVVPSSDRSGNDRSDGGAP